MRPRLTCALQRFADLAEAAIERLLGRLDQRQLEAGREKREADARAHRAGADDADVS